MEKKSYPDNTVLYYVRIPGPPSAENCRTFAAAYGFVFPAGSAKGLFYTVDSDGKTTLCISWANPATGDVDAAARAGRNKEENMAQMYKLATTRHSLALHSIKQDAGEAEFTSQTIPQTKTQTVSRQNTSQKEQNKVPEKQDVKQDGNSNGSARKNSGGSTGAIRRFVSMALLLGQLVYVSFFVPGYRLLTNISYSGAMTCILTFALPLVLVLLVYASGLRAKTRYKAERMPLKYQGTDKDDPDVVLKGGLRRLLGWVLIAVQIVKYIRNTTGFTHVVTTGGFFNWLWYLLPGIAGLLLLRWALIARVRGKVLASRYEAVQKFDAMNQEPAAVHTAEAEAESHDYDFELTNETTDTPVIPDRGPVIPDWGAVIPPDPPEAFWSAENWSQNYAKFMKELEAFAEALGDLIAASEQERNAFLEETEVIDPKTEGYDSRIFESLELLKEHWVRIVNRIPGHPPVTAADLQFRKNTASCMPLEIRCRQLAKKIDDLPYYPGAYEYTGNVRYVLGDAAKIWSEVAWFRSHRDS